MQQQRFGCLPAEQRPLPNARSRGRGNRFAIVPLAVEAAAKASLHGEKRQTPGHLYAPALEGCELEKWPHVWRAPARQKCATSDRKYVFSAEVESSFQPNEFTKVVVNYLDRTKTEKHQKKKQLRRVRQACIMLTQVASTAPCSTHVTAHSPSSLTACLIGTHASATCLTHTCRAIVGQPFCKVGRPLCRHHGWCRLPLLFQRHR